MKVKISLFRYLDEIREAYGVKDEKWAKASHNIRRPTISELRRLLKSPNEHIGRSCTYVKLSALYDGLHALIGGKQLRKTLEEKLRDEKDQEIRFLMLVMAMRHIEPDGRNLVENTMRTVIKASEEKSGK